LVEAVHRARRAYGGSAAGWRVAGTSTTLFGMRVLLFGAGASFNAGYPLSKNLINEIEKEARDSRIDNLSRAWAEWQHLRDNSSGLASYLLGNSNPEVVLSLPDLCEAARDYEDREAFGKAREAFSTGSDDPGEIWNHLKSEGRKLANQAIAARERFRDCLNQYFLYKHYLDSKPANKPARDYLRQVLSTLVAGDKVLTLNWDTTVERTLLEDDRWNPMDGYGFRKILCRGFSVGLSEALEFELPESEVLVLKLHGSVGWHRTRAGRFYFEERYGYLRYLEYRHEGVAVPLTDPEPLPIGPPEDFLLGYPSFLKQVRGEEMRSIWYQAATALDEAESVEVWGYSLPQSDTAVRTLLNPLRFRRDVRVRVHDPLAEVQGRWKEFLGEAAEIDSARLG
jgi:hypothetical protein